LPKSAPSRLLPHRFDLTGELFFGFQDLQIGSARLILNPWTGLERIRKRPAGAS
jgi:hypothetical protein